MKLAYIYLGVGVVLFIIGMLCVSIRPADAQSCRTVCRVHVVDKNGHVRCVETVRTCPVKAAN